MDKTLGYIYSTGAKGANKSQFGQWVTMDVPYDAGYGGESDEDTQAPFLDTCYSAEGPLFLCKDKHTALVLPVAGSRVPNRVYAAMPMRWKSKKFVMSGRTTFSVMKVTFRGCVNLQIYVDNCCVYRTVLVSCLAFRLPPEVTGNIFEFEFLGKGNCEVTSFEIASSLEELAQSGQDE